MRALFKKSILMTLALLVITCGVYPVTVWIMGQLIFHHKANGSILTRNGNMVGSKFIAQKFERPGYFHPRPSAAGDKGYDATNSSGSNLALTNKKMLEGLNVNIKQALKENPALPSGQVPNDMVTASASGLDPDISPENAFAQGARVAQARHVPAFAIRDLVEGHINKPDLAVLGESHVNVLELNLALDENFPVKK